MGTTMTVTICPHPCLDSCGWVYATANTVAHCCTSGTVELSFLPVLCNGCVRNTMPLHVCDHTARHSVACIAVPATKLHASTGCTTNSQIPFLEQQTKTTSSGQHVMHIRMHTQTARITQASTSTTYCITVFAANIRRVKFFSCITLALMIWTVFWARIPKR